MTSAYFFGWDYTINKQEKTAWQLVNQKANFFTKRIDSHKNRIESIRIANWNALEQSWCTGRYDALYVQRYRHTTGKCDAKNFDSLHPLK